MGHIDDLKAKVLALETNAESKEAEIRMLLNERTDTLSPSVKMSQATLIIFEMLIENNLFMQKKGGTEKALKSKERLLQLLDINREFDKITSDNYCLKVFNRDLYTKNQLLRVEISDLKKEIDKTAKTFQDL